MMCVVGVDTEILDRKRLYAACGFMLMGTETGYGLIGCTGQVELECRIMSHGHVSEILV